MAITKPNPVSQSRARDAFNPMERFDFRGLLIAYVRAGEGEPIVFLHNGGTSHAIWRDVMAGLTSNHEVFALDLLGYGASEKPGTGYTLENYAAMVAAFVDAHDLVPVTLVGNCMGSAVSLAFAMQRPRDVRALILVNPLTEATFSAGKLGMTYKLYRSLPFVIRPLYHELGRLRLPTWSASQTLRLQLGSEGRARNLEQNAALRACHASPGQLRSLLAVVEDLESYGALDRFVPDEGFPPICTIWGLENRVLSPDAGRRLNRTLRPAREEWLERCGHLLMLEEPDEVSEIVECFLAEKGTR